MTIYGIGIDLVDTARIAQAIERQGERFLTRCFTEAEIRYCCSQGPVRQAQSFAARFAAKEAVSKAFGTGIGEKMNFTDIEVVRESTGQPSIRLHGLAAATAAETGVTEVKISLTHTATQSAAYAMAVVH